MSPIGVRLLRKATLVLNGHTISGGDLTYAVVAGVGAPSDDNPVGRGSGRFTIMGPGTITGTNHPPFSHGTAACVLLNDGRAGITGATGPVVIDGCVYGVRGSRLFADGGTPNGRGRLDIDHATVRGAYLSGIAVYRLGATDVAAVENIESGILAGGRAMVTNLTASDNDGIGIFAGKRLEGSNVTATGNGNNGVDTCGFGRIALTNVTATGNGLFGVCGDRVMLKSSTVTGNAFADIASRLAFPVLVDTTCGTSLKVDGTSWGVCAND